jgi:superfamily II DNA helicase RecQ
MQLTALLNRHRGHVTMTVVVSPLLALIEAQMRCLPGGLTAQTLSGVATKGEQRQTLRKLACAADSDLLVASSKRLNVGDIPELLFVTPEAIAGEHSGNLLRDRLAILAQKVRVAEALLPVRCGVRSALHALF